MLAVEAGFFPLDEQLKLVDRRWSEGLAEQAVWLSGLAAFEQGAAILQGVGGISMSRDSIWRRAQTCGKRFKQLEETGCQQAMLLPRKWDPPSRAVEPDRRMGTAIDGAMIHIREEGWKELKIGAVFDIAVRPTRDEVTDEIVDMAHAVNNTYVAHLGGPEVLGKMVWAEAKRRGWEQVQDTEALGDGASWIWNQISLHFGDSRQLVDWYHAKEHLSVAARLLKGDNATAHQRWFKSRETQLYQGHAAAIACELQAAAATTPTVADELRREAGYFWTNQLRMNYMEMREEQWPIGSGMVESAAKSYKARFCGPGMRWSRTGAEHLIPIRGAILSNRFHELWHKAHNSPQT